MRVPPCFLRVRVLDPERLLLRVWLPVFILWPVALACLVPTLVATCLVDVFRLLAGAHRSYTRLLVACLALVSETRGTEVFVQGKGRTVAVAVL